MGSYLYSQHIYILYNNDESDDNPMVWARSVVGRHRSKQGK